MKCRNQNLTEFGDAIDVQLLRNTLNRFGQYTEASEINSMHVSIAKEKAHIMEDFMVFDSIVDDLRGPVEVPLGSAM
ncbi:hypothetical protein FEM48_Zijuj07G0041700 [Ziziphus jujuba var. spinosa]|uniref:Uncharacterized protein n=1 Tax=Ziziphus jujuba var. spinosa TaxID=714518 RepID=A0A978V2D2_ZIZJJ|nr:hypothetical protein FEM48_Zijuj07G0041700 [Ziziphus jujuba var. spinosa]